MKKDIDRFYEAWISRVNLDKQIKDWLRFHVKYGVSCSYCGLPGKTHRRCREAI